MLYLHMFLFLMLVLLGVQENLNAILEMIFFSCNSSEIYLIIEWYFLVKDDSKISNCSSHSSCSLPRMILSSEGLFQNLEWINNMSVFSSLSFSYFVPSISKCQITVSNLVSNGVNVIIFEGLRAWCWLCKDGSLVCAFWWLQKWVWYTSDTEQVPKQSPEALLLVANAGLTANAQCWPIACDHVGNR